VILGHVEHLLIALKAEMAEAGKNHKTTGDFKDGFIAMKF
jgi:hypothetical protein